jgi:xanthine/CO dehydrogenase XdhC/CoxF family maturation factor
MTQEQEQLFGIDKLNIPRSQIPAVTHVDYSARIQTVHSDREKLYFDMDTHWNPAGHKLAAKVMYPSIIRDSRETSIGMLWDVNWQEK